MNVIKLTGTSVRLQHTRGHHRTITSKEFGCELVPFRRSCFAVCRYMVSCLVRLRVSVLSLFLASLEIFSQDVFVCFLLPRIKH